ncbi:DUF6789 family protein [Massilia sp. H6]|uniref:DUF6789 family protein n=1 Tax=Massilia sp. H6 TaxID=2970464 RepID=UPI0021692F7C|nr:DUF6789 family protein [Massilia sp. H6]UVW30059.1 hypothetical protein NRS07_08050 [Massilia sp. H6]
MSIAKGFVAGLAATAVLSVLMVMKQVMGIMPELNLPKMIAGMMGAPDSPAIGWLVHVMIGVLGYGAAIALVARPALGKSAVSTGLLIGFIGWIIMMVMLMPMAGAGFFGMNMGIMAPVMTLILHLIFGAVLGWTYDRLTTAAARGPAAVH